MRALTWVGTGRLAVEEVPDPRILNDHDVIVKVGASSVCGSDLHLLNGFVPAMQAGDVIGHEFLGEVVEAGPGVTRHQVGDRVVVCSVLGCGECWFCQHDLWSACDNSNPNPWITETVYGRPTAGILGYSHAMGGFGGSHAQYVRVPFADHGAFPVPDGLSDDTAVFASDAVPTGWMGADLANVEGGDVVAVWGAGAVGQMAARAAILMGAERVVVIDRVAERLTQVEQHIGAEALDYEQDDVAAVLTEITGGRGPDACIEAVGMEAHGTGPQYAYDRVKQVLRMQSDRSVALRDAIHTCRKGGTVSVLGVFGGVTDKFPMGAVLNKGLTLRAAQQHGQRYVPRLLELMERNEITTGHLRTHTASLDDGPGAYRMFGERADGCVRVVLKPNG